MRKIVAFSSTLGAYLVSASSAFAQLDTTDVTLCPKEGSNFINLCGLQISDLIGPAINFLFIIAVIITLFYLVWGGLKWLTSGGDKTAVQAAREHIVAAVVGLVIIFLSYFILNFILVFFLGQEFGISSFSIPHL
ncbi:MAG: hypothetical protein A3B38_03620 [Candidatus Levybacteria bacterium RIFCSPLOWO2_01_FULL_36_13]|nr:MAG: hypothetical protein A2684_00555 [Candidatus Levybacteria bacterium RIFCSPHIGHO2_01_FULL_36_15b]OGH34221.1 MAG: hypothetical protein A3B38_03620 [Candidatus Levybacteria bacterium RIFCSPLOWO2_01_FULL_36_13]